MESRAAIEAFKKAWEVLALYYGDKNGVDVIVSRLGGIYGPLYETLNNHVAKMCWAAAHGEAADFSGRMGQPYATDGRGYCYVKDCAAGVQQLQMSSTLKHRIYNVSGGRGSFGTYGEIADVVKRVAPGTEIPLLEGEAPGTKPDAYMDVTRAHQDAGYEPEYDFERGISEYVDWLRTHAN